MQPQRRRRPQASRSPAPAQAGPVGGFTMVELIVVIAIMAIVGAMVIPYAVGTTDLQARSAARMVMSDLEYAQNQAITTQTDITVSFSAAGNSYTVSNASGPLIHPITKQVYTVGFNAQNGLDRVALSSALFGGDTTVTFNPLGAPSADGTVTLVAGAHTYRVEVAPITGRVSVSGGT